MIGFLFFVLNGILSFIGFMLIASAIVSWLIYFDILSTRNSTVWRITSILDQFTAPILEPVRRIIPSVGGFDISFIVCILIIRGMQYYLLPIAEKNMHILFGG